MLTVHEVSELAGISVRTLHHYDEIGLLSPAERTTAGYRLYDENDLARLQQILLFRELEFPLADIRRIVDNPDFDQERALDQQIELLELKRKHINRLIKMAKTLKTKGMETMDFEAFDTSELDEYAKRAKESWGNTSEWAEFEKKNARRSAEEQKGLGNELMALFVPFGQMAADGTDPASDEALAQARSIQNFITKHYYTCSDEVFLQLGRAYGAGGEFTQNINEAAGQGAAEFAAAAIEALVVKA